MTDLRKSLSNTSPYVGDRANSGGAIAFIFGQEDNQWNSLKADSEGYLYSKNMVKDYITLQWVPAQNTKVDVAGDLVIAGEMEINNFPIGFNINNFPATQPVSGTIGVSEDNKDLIVYEDGDILYVCRGAIGSIKSDAVWQIKKVDGMNITWAHGNANYDNQATDLATVEGYF